MQSEKCEGHTPCPTGYLAWHSWAARMSKTHRQVRCPQCRLYAVWIEKGKRQPLSPGPDKGRGG